MQILNQYPPAPVWKKVKHLAEAGDKVVITYGDTLYNPGKQGIPDHVLAHEEVHSARQLAYKGGPAAYMDRFLADPVFRLDEEVAAYVVQLRFIKKRYGDRAAVISLPSFIKRLSGPLYGNCVDSLEARKRLMVYVKKV